MKISDHFNWNKPQLNEDNFTRIASGFAGVGFLATTALGLAFFNPSKSTVVAGTYLGASFLATHGTGNDGYLWLIGTLAGSAPTLVGIEAIQDRRLIVHISFSFSDTIRAVNEWRATSAHLAGRH